MPSSSGPREPSEDEIRKILKALDSSGILKDVDNLSQDEEKQRLLEELSRSGLTNIEPDMVIFNKSHWFFIIHPEPPPHPQPSPPSGPGPGVPPSPPPPTPI